MISPTLLLMVAKIINEERQKAWQEEAKISHILQTTGAKPRFRDQLYVRIGDFLISAGQRLQEHARPVMCPDSTIHPSECWAVER